jgi:hypothetical protein
MVLNSADLIINRLSILKIDSAVRLRFIFRPQTINIFILSVITTGSVLPIDYNGLALRHAVTIGRHVHQSLCYGIVILIAQ